MYKKAILSLIVSIILCNTLYGEVKSKFENFKCNQQCCSTSKPKHWANDSYQELLDRGIVQHGIDFNNPVNYGEAQRCIEDILKTYNIVDLKQKEYQHNITRIEFIELICSELEDKVVTSGRYEEIVFKDISLIDNLFPIQFALKIGLVKGDSSSMLNPYKELTYGEMCVFLKRMDTYVKYNKMGDI